MKEKTLRPYQQRFVREVHRSLREINRVVGCAPTGSGKRIMACWWASRIVGCERRLGVVTDRRILVDQMAEECRTWGIPFGILMGDSPRNDEALVQVCSIQTMVTRGWYDTPEADWWIIDEAHKATDAYTRLISQYPNAKVLGLTATPVGAQGKSLVRDGLFERVIEPVKNSELIKEGHLLPIRCYAPSEPDVQGVSLSGGEFNQKALAHRVEECTVFADVFQWYARFAHIPCIVFAPRLIFARGIAEQFSDRGYAAEVIEARTSKRQRRDIFREFADGELRILVSVDVLREGFDAPCAGMAIDLQPNRQLRGWWQKIGRIKRPYPGQQEGIWLDFAGNFWRFCHPNEDPEWPQDGSDETTQDIIRRARKEQKDPWICPNCGFGLAFWQRVTDNQCPNCGAEIRTSIRRIRMRDGTMRQVSAKSKQAKIRDNEVKDWFAFLYPCAHRGLTLNVARAMFHKKTGRWPGSHLPMCPDRHSADWGRKITSVYPDLLKRKS